MGEIRTVETGSASAAQGDLIEIWGADGGPRAAVLVDGKRVEGRLVPRARRGGDGD